MKSKKILLIEDEKGLTQILTDRLVDEGYNVQVRHDGIRGEVDAKQIEWDLILLDIMLPGKDGFQVCENLRKDGIKTPILMLTARTTQLDTILGFRLGADDYLTKPFDMEILLARIKALIRRFNGNMVPNYTETKQNYSFGNFVLSTVRKELKKGNLTVSLHTQEYRLLEFFVQNPDRTISREELLDKVWDYDAIATTRTVDVHIARLRKKIEDQNTLDKRRHRYLETVRGYGYRFNP